MKKIIKELNPFNNIEPDNKIIYTIKIILKTFLVYFISLLVAEGVVMAMHYPLGYDPMGNPMPLDVLLLATYYGYIITILFFIIFTKKIDKSKLEEIGLNKNFKSFFKGILLGIIPLVIIISLLSLIGQIKFSGINVDVNYTMIILFLFGYLIQSAMEEIVSRGYLLNNLKKKISIPLSVTISVLFFSILHFDKLFSDGILLGIVGCLNLCLISIIFTLLSLKDKNIYSAIGLHFIWNFTLFNIIGLNLSGLETTNAIFNFTSNNSFLSGASYGIESSIITTAILVIIMLIIGRKVKIKEN